LEARLTIDLRMKISNSNSNCNSRNYKLMKG